jgi:transcriptional regulator with XRE-family HTH domain
VDGYRPEVLREYRERAGLSHADLASVTGITVHELQQYELARVPGPDRLAILAKAFGIKPLDFVDRDELGYGLKALRAEAGIRQGELLLRAGLSPAQLHYLESGRRSNLAADLAERLARVLGVSVRAVRRANAWDVARRSAGGQAPGRPGSGGPGLGGPGLGGPGLGGPGLGGPGSGGLGSGGRGPGSSRRGPGGPAPDDFQGEVVLPGPVRGTPRGGPAFDAASFRARRERAGLSVMELRDLTGIPRAELDAYEDGGRSPRPDRLAKLARAFGIAPLDMLDRDVIGYGLAALRTAAGLRQQDLVISADLSPATLRSMEHGTARRLTRPVAERLARALGTTAEAVREAHAWDVANFDAIRE